MKSRLILMIGIALAWILVGGSHPAALIPVKPAQASILPAPVAAGPALTVNAGGARYPINPLIYGMNFASEALASELRLPVNRWGGNATTRYNWQNDTSNRANDWYFENIPNDNAHPELLPDGSSSDLFVEQNRRTSTQTLLTVPLIGWTPKSRTFACGFSISKYGPQDAADYQWHPDCGNGLHNGQPLTAGDPSDTSQAIGPNFVVGWISHLVARYGAANQGGVTLYNLDNEPMLWNSTHQDVHPLPTSYDEIRDRTIQYAAAIKAADPGARTLGPVVWGWTSYFWSALDRAAGGSWWNNPVDRLAHGDTPFLAWYLQQMKTYQDQHQVRLLDYLDVHIYPQGSGVFSESAGDAATQTLRLRSTRALWDPTYKDESWINDYVYLIPRLRQWVAQYYPGTQVALSEYNWGALGTLNGALAQADILGIFGRERLDLAALWTAPDSSQPAAYAFRMYRNYDGAGHAFGETSISAASANQDNLAVYAAQRASDGALTVMVINKTGGNLTSAVSLSGFAPQPAAAVYRYSASNLNAIQHLANQAVSATGFTADFPANSITLLVIPSSRPLDQRQYLPLMKR